MKTLLKIQASIYGSGGQSSKLADQFVSQWLANNPNGRVVTRDLSAEPVPHLTQERFAAFLTAPAERTKAKRKKSLIYVDHMQNAYGKSVVAPYSVRPKPGATVGPECCWCPMPRPSI